jgi:transposase InsO family protein
VIPEHLKQKIIQQIYKEFGIGSGFHNLYEKISRRYLGITRNDVKQFLQNKEEYQLGKTPVKMTQKKLYVSAPNNIWYADLIDFNSFIKSNKGYRYLLTITDGYSRFVMMYALKHKEALDIYNAFEKAFKNYGIPKAINSDLGLEFHNEVVTSLFRKEGVKHLSSVSYNPKGNALAEATNGYVRRVLKQLFLEKGNLIWYNDLDRVQKSINDTAPNSTGKPRSVLYYQKDGEFQQQNKKQNKQEKLQEQKNTFEIGDIVRIALKTIETEIRKKIKMNLSKLVIANFSKELYEVVKIIKPRTKAMGTVTKMRYKIADLKGDVLPQIFNENDLLLVNTDKLKKNKQLTHIAVKKLNKIPLDDWVAPVEEAQTRSKDIKNRLRK